MLNQEGNLAECTGDNIFIVRYGEVQTPTTSDGILEGVTRHVMIQLCKKLSIPCVEKSLQRHDLYIADECFLTGTAAEVVPVTQNRRSPHRLQHPRPDHPPPDGRLPRPCQGIEAPYRLAAACRA